MMESTPKHATVLPHCHVVAHMLDGNDLNQPQRAYKHQATAIKQQLKLLHALLAFQLLPRELNIHVRPPLLARTLRQ